MSDAASLDAAALGNQLASTDAAQRTKAAELLSRAGEAAAPAAVPPGPREAPSSPQTRAGAPAGDTRHTHAKPRGTQSTRHGYAA